MILSCGKHSAMPRLFPKLYMRKIAAAGKEQESLLVAGLNLRQMKSGKWRPCEVDEAGFDCTLARRLRLANDLEYLLTPQ